MESKLFDIIVIGAGSGGLNIAGFMNKAGFKTLLIDKADELIGGDCLNFGCVPSKALIHVARTINEGKNAQQFGVSISGEVDMKKVKEYIKDKKDIIREHENAEYLRSIGMTVVLGNAEFVSKNEVKVDGAVYKGKKIVIATGSRPRKMNIPEIKDTPIYTNETIFDIEYVPKKFLFIGAGPIGLEIGQAFNYLGSDVTFLQRSDKILPREDSDISKILLNNLKNDGVKFLFKCVEKNFISPNELSVESEGNQMNISFDAIFVGIGRELNIEGLALDKAGIAMERNGNLPAGKTGRIKVDNYLRTTNKDIYLCGDIVGGPQFTHAAELHAAVILKNFFSPFKKKVSYDNLAWVTYTNPEIATFGLNETELKEKGIQYNVLESSFEEDDRAITDNVRDGKLKLFVSRKNILGGTMIARNAGELTQELILAQISRLPLSNIFNKIYPYPTASRINKQVVSKQFAGKLTDFNKRLLKLFFH